MLRTPLRSARWVFDCNAWKPTESEWLRAASGVQEDEKVRIDQFVFKRDAKYSMVGRLMMRKYVVDSTGLSWEAVILARDANNKPFFPSDKFRVQFNVSHQGNYAVLAGETTEGKVGVDVMKIEYSGGKSVSEFFRLMNRQFSDEEWTVINSQTSEWDRLKYFYRFWCLKESYVKATGTGITVNLKEISFRVNSVLNASKFVCDTDLYLQGVRQNDWTFEEIMLDSEHCCAVALNVIKDDQSVSDKPEHFKLLSLDELLKLLQPVTVPDLAYCRRFLAKEDAPL